MEIHVTNHAVTRYRERLVDYSSLDKVIINRLKEIARNGRQVSLRPSDYNNCAEVKYKGISIVTVVQDNSVVVLTCLGTDRYRKWLKHQDSFMRVYQSTRYCKTMAFGE